MNPDADNHAVVLLSGGLDSATVLAMAIAEGLSCYALSVDYGQRHDCELEAAAGIAQALGAKAHRVVSVDFGQFGGSALTDASIAVPHEPSDGIPVTYVPARNTIMLSIALGWAEILSARRILIGVNAVDYSGYPDCRPAFIEQFERLCAVATAAGVDGQRFSVLAPLIDMSKAEIIRTGVRLGLDYRMTSSCYEPNAAAEACGSCDACRLRRDGFAAAGIVDPTRYRADSA